jgi:sugar/nucleoside kinase (ribokinase family)
MAIFNLGSINIDLIYKVPHFPTAGETLTTRSFMRALGGKGANQSIALAAAGASVFHIGAANPDDSWLFDEMRASGVDITYVQESGTPTGHAIVSVNDEGENQILLHPGANRAIDIAAANAVLDQGVWVIGCCCRTRPTGPSNLLRRQRRVVFTSRIALHPLRRQWHWRCCRIVIC